MPLSWKIQGHVGWGSEQPDGVEDVPARCWEVELDDFSGSLPAHMIL